jgi:aryl-alcohol dehydrogenase-like predicted oxidoreductase
VGGALVSGGEYDVDRNRAEKLGFLVKGDVRNLSQAGIRFVLRDPDVSTALVGFSSLDQIEEAAACSDQGPILESDLIPLRRLWATNFGM